MQKSTSVFFLYYKNFSNFPLENRLLNVDEAVLIKDFFAFESILGTFKSFSLSNSLRSCFSILGFYNKKIIVNQLGIIL